MYSVNKMEVEHVLKLKLNIFSREMMVKAFLDLWLGWRTEAMGPGA